MKLWQALLIYIVIMGVLLGAVAFTIHHVLMNYL